MVLVDKVHVVGVQHRRVYLQQYASIIHNAGGLTIVQGTYRGRFDFLTTVSFSLLVFRVSLATGEVNSTRGKRRSREMRR